jgi:antitoxin VapB
MSEPKRAKVFWSGRSQAVRLPKEFRFETEEVAIRREGSSVILEPLEKPAWPSGYWESFGPVGPDFVTPPPLPDAPHRDAILEEWGRVRDSEGG